MGASGPDTADVEALKLEVSELRQKCEQLQEENNELRAKVCFHAFTVKEVAFWLENLEKDFYT